MPLRKKVPSQHAHKAPTKAWRDRLPPHSPSLSWSSSAPPPSGPLFILQHASSSLPQGLCTYHPFPLLFPYCTGQLPSFTKQLKCHFFGETYDLPSCHLLFLTTFITTIIMCMINFLVFIYLARVQVPRTRDYFPNT